MSEFSFYDELINLSNKNNDIKNTTEKTINNNLEEKTCQHENKNLEKGISICIDCGEELSENLSTDKEWRYYGQNDTKYNSDPNRVQMRKTEEKNIYNDVENFGFSEILVDEANKIYSDITKTPNFAKGKILRGNSRKSVILACIFHAYKISNNPQSIDKLIKIFGIERKSALKGLKFVNLKAPKKYKLRTTYITPMNLIKEIVEKFDGTEDQIKQISEIYEKIKDKSEKLNKSRPQSVASAIVYYWILKNKKNITCKEFAEKVDLSELTINKIIKEIENILNEKM